MSYRRNELFRVNAITKCQGSPIGVSVLQVLNMDHSSIGGSNDPLLSEFKQLMMISFPSRWFYTRKKSLSYAMDHWYKVHSENPYEPAMISQCFHRFHSVMFTTIDHWQLTIEHLIFSTKKSLISFAAVDFGSTSMVSYGICLGGPLSVVKVPWALSKFKATSYYCVHPLILSATHMEKHSNSKMPSGNKKMSPEAQHRRSDTHGIQWLFLRSRQLRIENGNGKWLRSYTPHVYPIWQASLWHHISIFWSL